MKRFTGMNIPHSMIVAALVLLIGLCPDRLFAGQDSAVGISLEGNLLVSSNSIVYYPNNVVSMWVKIVPEENSRTRNLILKFLKEKRKDYQNYEYSSFLSELDCERGMHREISIMHFNKNKNILYAATNVNASWEPADHRNGFHMLHMAFCSDGKSLAYGKSPGERSGRAETAPQND